MALLKCGGIHWDPTLIGWGRIGRPPVGINSRKEVLAYWSKKDTRGRLSDEEREKRTVNVWPCKAVYGLFEKGTCIYIGEGVLGDCLLRHWRNDTLVGRWDSFSWVSPDEYVINPDMASIAPVDDATSGALELTAKDLIELLELVAIRLGSPQSNSQLPSNDKEIKWLDQVRSNTSLPPLEEKINRILAELADLRGSGNKG